MFGQATRARKGPSAKVGTRTPRHSASDTGNDTDEPNRTTALSHKYQAKDVDNDDKRHKPALLSGGGIVVSVASLFSLKDKRNFTSKANLTRRFICVAFFLVLLVAWERFDSSGESEPLPPPRVVLYVSGRKLKNLTRFKSSFRTPHRTVNYRKPKYWEHSMADPLYEGDCVPMHSWQETSFLTCNTMHEIDMAALSSSRMKLVNYGYWRDVWRIYDVDRRKHALKTQRFEHDYEERNYDRHRRDAVSMERLSASPNVINQYAFCANSGVSEYADQGDLEIIKADEYPENAALFSPWEKLQIAYQVSRSMADLHNIDKNGKASIAHTDIDTKQYLFLDGVWKLNDFNRARFLRRNKKTGGTCTFTVGSNKGDFRSPEEYKYEGEDEKVDIYSMGNIFYVLLAEENVFPGWSSKKVKKYVRKGGRPKLPKQTEESENPATKALIQAMKMCHSQDPRDRANAHDVLDFLGYEIEKIEKMQLGQN